MTINISLPEEQSNLRPRISVIGVGGAGKAVASYFISEMSKRKNLIITGRFKSSNKFSKILKILKIYLKIFKKIW